MCLLLSWTALSGWLQNCWSKLPIERNRKLQTVPGELRFRPPIYWAILFFFRIVCVTVGWNSYSLKIKMLKSISNLRLTPWQPVAQRNSYPWVKSPKQPLYINTREDKLQQLRSIKNIYGIHVLHSIRAGRATSSRRAGQTTATAGAATP